MSEIEPRPPEEESTASEIELQPQDLAESGAEHLEESTPPVRPVGRRVHPLATFLAGLVIGILVGYMGRSPAPSLSPGNTPTAPEPENRTAVPTQAAERPASNTAPQELVDTIIAQTRHFKGDPNAPVTIIEFSDFQ